MDRETIIRDSMRVFACGLFSLVPVVGFITAVYALGNGLRIHSACKNEWNPASNYLRWGMAVATFCLGIDILAALIVGFQLLPTYLADSL